MTPSPEQLCRDINRMSAYLAQDDFGAWGPGEDELAGLDAVVLLGNQVVATVTAACRLAQRAPVAARLLFSGGVGHSTGLLYENLRRSHRSGLVEPELIQEAMGEAEMCSVVAQGAYGIPPGRILVESQSTNSGENARFSQGTLREALGRVGPVLILQDPTMLRRSVLTWVRDAELANAGIAGAETRVLSHAAFVPRVEPGPNGLPRLVAGQDRGTWTPERFLALLLGEMGRLNDDEDGYGPRGRNYLPHVDIPETVWESYGRVSASSLARAAMR
jgi:hypothetical protein